jgi:type IV pilus assembly protein PilO
MRWLTIAAIFVLIIFVGYCVDLGGLSHQLTRLKQEKKNLQLHLGIESYKLMLAENEAAKLPQLKNKLKDWQTKLITQSSEDDLLKEILKTSKEDQLQVVFFNPQSEVKENLYFKKKINMRIIGCYEQLAYFVNQIANMPWVVTVSNLSISQDFRAEETNSKTLVSADITVNIYRYY